MHLDEALSNDLRILSDGLDDPDVDLSESLGLLVADVGAVVRSYSGLTVVVEGSDPPLTFTVLEETSGGAAVRASASFPLDLTDDAIRVGIVLYAATPGAFVDLVADLAWMTGRVLTDFVLDRHLDVPHGSATVSSVRAASAINQAIGVLLGRGHTPEQAERILAAEAPAGTTDRYGAAVAVLEGLTSLPLPGSG